MYDFCEMHPILQIPTSVLIAALRKDLETANGKLSQLREQIARKNAEELDKEVAKAVLDNGLIDDYRNGYIRGLRKAQDLQAAIARGEK